MPRPSVVTAAAVVLALILVVGAGASGRAEARTGRIVATAPVLLAHDTSTALVQRPRARAHVHAFPRLVSFARAALRTPLQALLPPARNTVRRALAPQTLLTFDGDPQLAGVDPSDANGDIGATQYVQAVNGVYGIYSRTGRLLDRVTSSTFWSSFGGPDGAGLCATSPQGDPSVDYDRAADRWVVSEFAFAADASGNPQSPFVMCVAVSATSDATGVWYRYAFQVSTSLLPDYPKLAVWSDGYYLSFNQFDASGSWAGAGAMALQRSAMLNGLPAQARYFDLSNVNPVVGGMLAADIESQANQPIAGEPELYLQAYEDPVDSSRDRIELWSFHVDWSAPVTGSTFQPLVSLPVQPFEALFSCGAAGMSCMAQPDPTAPTLDPVAAVYADSSLVLPQLMYRLLYNRSSSGVETLTVSDTVNAGGTAGIRWYELWNTNGGGWVVHDQGTYAPADGNDRFMPSLAFDNSGDLAVGYTLSGAGVSPSLAYTGRLNGDPAGTMTVPEQVLVAGTGSEVGSSRWGDYSSMSLDPVDGCTFWYTGQYELGQGAWQSRVGAFKFSTCTPFQNQVPLLTADPGWSAPLVREGQTISAVGGTFSNSSSVSYQWRRCDSYGLNCLDIAGATGTSHVITAADAAGDRTLRVEETATNATGSATSVSTATPVVQSLPPANVTLPVIFGTAAVGQTLGTSTGTWSSSSPLRYTYRWRRCSNGTCTNIAGANSATYVVQSADVGDTLDVVVSAVNTGGGTDANASATSAVVAAPPAPPAASGSSSSTDVSVALSAEPAPTSVGATLNYFVTVANKTTSVTPDVVVSLPLPSSVDFISAAYDRGAGCTVSSGDVLTCDLGVLPADAVSIVTVAVRVMSPGTVTTRASVAVAGDTNSANNSSSATVTATGAAAIPLGLNDRTGQAKTVVDRVPPKAQAIASAAEVGALAKLRFRISDDHGTARALVTVRRGGRRIGSASSGYGPVAYGTVYYVGWRVPPTLRRGTYRFCVVAVDPAGNKSPASCAPLAVR